MKILISPSSFGQCGTEPFDILKKNNFEWIVNPYGRKLTEDEVIQLGEGCVGIVAGVEPLNQQVMATLPELKCISRVGVGLDNIDLDYAAQKNIIIKNTPDGPSQAVAELTVALVFNLLRKVSKADANIRKGIWKKEIGHLLLNKKIGIYGLGRIGKLVAKMFIALGNQVIAYDISNDKEWLEKNSVRQVERQTLFRESDIISLHVPKSKKGKPIIGAEELKLMKSTSFLINISRGGVVDESSLYDYLKNHKIAGAAMDVFEIEPYNGVFTQLENTLLTPHLGSYAQEGKLKMEIDATNNLIQALNMD